MSDPVPNGGGGSHSGAEDKGSASGGNGGENPSPVLAAKPSNSNNGGGGGGEPPPRYDPPPQPVNGMVHPPTAPPPHRPGRVTNQLQYLKNNVMKAMMKHQYSWPFMNPVDTVKFALHDYFKIIKRPMDLGCIKKRLDNNFYWCAQECIDDVSLMFNNCYLYNKSGEDVAIMGQSLEKFFRTKLKSMPVVECVVGTASAGASGGNGGGGGGASKTPKGKKVVPPGGALVTPKPEPKVEASDKGRRRRHKCTS